MRKNEMADKTYMAYRLNERLEIKRAELQAERDELQRQAKEVIDCIVHHAPSGFPILKYSSTVEALGALFEETNELETTIR